MSRPLRVGTRGSQLALWQSRAVATRLESLGHAVELVIVKTTGDQWQEAPLGEAGGKRLFVQGLEDALLGQVLDLAVHSAKDLPADLPEGLTLAAALSREDPRDALVLPAHQPGGHLASILGSFSDGTVRTIGTSSVRRVAQLTPLLTGAIFAPVRGNVDTRLRKLDTGEFDALVLACAGLRRLNLVGRISAPFPLERCVPAPGQGIIVVEAREGDALVTDALRHLHDDAAGVALAAERSLVAALGGDCQIPLGALARLNGAGIEMDAIVCSPDGGEVIRRQARGSAAHPESLGKRLAEELAAAGAEALLDQVRHAARRSNGAY